MPSHSQPTRTATLHLLRTGIYIFFVTIIIAYAVWRSLDYVRGPQIKIFSPIDGTTVASSTLSVQGQTTHTSSLKLNGREIQVDEQGDFSETIILFNGMNLITITGKDRFDRQIEEILRIFRP